MASLEGMGRVAGALVVIEAGRGCVVDRKDEAVAYSFEISDVEAEVDGSEMAKEDADSVVGVAKELGVGLA